MSRQSTIDAPSAPSGSPVPTRPAEIPMPIGIYGFRRLDEDPTKFGKYALTLNGVRIEEFDAKDFKAPCFLGVMPPGPEADKPACDRYIHSVLDVYTRHQDKQVARADSVSQLQVAHLTAEVERARSAERSMSERRSSRLADPVGAKTFAEMLNLQHREPRLSDIRGWIGVASLSDPAVARSQIEAKLAKSFGQNHHVSPGHRDYYVNHAHVLAAMAAASRAATIDDAILILHPYILAECEGFQAIQAKDRDASAAVKIARRCDLQLRYARKFIEPQSETEVGNIVKELTDGKIPAMVHPLPGPHVTVTAADFDFWVGAPQS